jgi:ABC-type phosphate transport system substrate-binding protein
MHARARLIAVSASIPLGLSLALAPPGAASARSFVAISGSGSSFSSVAIDVRAQDVRPEGLVVNYNPDGSSAGQADYIANQDDFAASDVPFRTSRDKLAGEPGQGRPAAGREHPWPRPGAVPRDPRELAVPPAVRGHPAGR